MTSPEQQRERARAFAAYGRDGQGYLALKSTRSQAISYALADSPVAQLACIVRGNHEAVNDPARTTTIEPVALEPDRFTPYAYSPAIAVGDLLLVSGQSSIDEHGEVVRPHDLETQGRQVFTNLARVLEAEARVSGMS